MTECLPERRELTAIITKGTKMRKSFAVWALLLLAGLCAVPLRADIMVRSAKGDIIYQYSNGVMYKGHARNNKKMFKFERNEIRNMQGKRLALWKNNENALYDGGGGRVMYVYADRGGHPRSKGAKAVIFIDGRKIYQGHGAGAGCPLILYPDQPLPIPVALYLAHTVTGGKPPAPTGLKVDFSKVPYGYYLGPKGTGKIVLALRGNNIYFGEKTENPVYVHKNLKFYRNGDFTKPAAFCMDRQASLYRGDKVDPRNKVMYLNWFNCYAAGKSGTDAIGTLQYVGENILTGGFTKPSQRPNFAGKPILVSSTLPNNKVPMELRIFIVYLTQLDPEFKAFCQSLK